MFYVIGSGPSGVALTSALLNSGHKVTMLDYGLDLTLNQQSNILQLSNTPLKKWNKSLIDNIRYRVTNDMPLKLAYKDDFPYRNAAERNNIEYDNCGYLPSLAQGGLSNVWGNAVLMPLQSDIDSWPITLADLLPHYKSLSNILTIAAREDDLITDYPLFDNIFSPKTSTQAQQFYNKLNKYKYLLDERNVKFGYARNAYQAQDCQECNLCMYGCPYDLLYNSKQTLSKLLDNKNFSYISGVFIERFEERANGMIRIFYHQGNDNGVFNAERLFIAAGALASTALVMRSLEYSYTVKLFESPYFIFPLLDFSLRGNFINGNSNTLSQLFMEINDSDISDKTIHLQIYGYNEMLKDALENKLGFLKHVARPMTNFLLNKMMVVQGFLHSNCGESIELKLERSGKLTVTGTNHEVDKKIKQIINKFKSIGISPTYQKSIPGRSFHCGGSMPMIADGSAVKNLLTTDKFGVVNGLSKVHVVDSSILPSIPAQTITYTVMANAHRIGSLI